MYLAITLILGGLLADQLADYLADQNMKKLTALGIKNAPDGKLGDGGGLELRKKDETGKWVWRYSIAGRRREMGLGSYPDVSLADARKAREKWAAILAQGKDPISERKAQQDAIRRELEKTDPTLMALADDVFEARKASLKGAGKAGRWISPLEIHVFPKLGKKTNQYNSSIGHTRCHRTDLENQTSDGHQGDQPPAHHLPPGKAHGL